MRFLKLVFPLLLPLLIAPFALAQSEADGWRVVIYQDNHPESLGDLIFVGSDGIEKVLTLPPDISEYVNPQLGARQITFNSDLSLVAMTYPLSDESPLILFDVNTQEVRYITLADNPTLEAGPFSPDGSQIVVSYYIDATVDSGLAVLDVETGEAVAQIPMDEILARLRVDEEETTLMTRSEFGDWTEDGVYFAPTCGPCDGISDTSFLLWHPETNTLSESEVYHTDFGDTLQNTGELLYTVPNPNYAIGEVSIFIPPNVVEYYADGFPTVDYGPREAYVLAGEPVKVDAPVVFQSPEIINLFPARWVLDGQAFFVTEGSFDYDFHPSSGTLVYRDGTQQIVELEPDMRFLAGTPDGWLMTHRASVDSSVELYHYTVVDGEISVERIPAELSGDLMVAYQPALGQGELEPFTAQQ